VATKLFFALQLDHPYALPLPSGRYLLRDPHGEPELVVVIGPAASTTTLTAIEPTPLADAGEGERRLAGVEGEAALAALQPQLAKVFQGLRLATGTLLYPPAAAALAGLRAGYGSGEQLAAGELARAKELGGERRGPLRRLFQGRRRTALPAEERLAAVLSGRLPPLLCEELALRARLALGAGEVALAAFELGGALRFALRELEAEVAVVGGNLGERLVELHSLAQALSEGEDGRPTPPREELERGLQRLEAALRLRALVRSGSYKRRSDGADG
jgi:hypothetical protein